MFLLILGTKQLLARKKYNLNTSHVLINPTRKKESVIVSII